MDEYTTTSGKIVRLGQLYRDKRTSNVRTLRVDRILDPWDEAHPEWREVECTVIRQECDGNVTEPMRTTLMKIGRLADGPFVLVEEA